MESWAHWAGILLLGAVEGLTEFLPVSSTGHLIVVAHFLDKTTDADKLLEVVIQLGAISAVGYQYRNILAAWVEIFTAKIRRAPPNPSAANNTALLINLIIAFLPAAVCGFLFYGIIKEYLFSPRSVGLALLVGGIVIIWAEKQKPPPRLNQLHALTRKDAVIIGCCQTLALVPGVSRAGATIIGAMLWGVERRTATEFSFLLALPTMFAASFYDLLKNRDLLNWALAGDIAVGFVAAFLSALLVIRLLIRYVSRHDFTPFGWYRIFFGAAVLFVFY